MKNKHTQGRGVGVLIQSSTINYTKILWQLLNEGEASYTTHFTFSQEMWDNYHIFLKTKKKKTHMGERGWNTNSKAYYKLYLKVMVTLNRG